MNIQRRCGAMGCERPPRFFIYAGFEDDFDACEIHVGQLLTTPIWKEGHNSHWDVSLIPGASETPHEDSTWFWPAGQFLTEVRSAELLKVLAAIDGEGA